jgi:DNA-binding GntR family transcriptional regulator
MDAKTAPATERAYEHVKAAILAQEYAGGRMLTEGEIAEAVGVSRTPVREALLRLAAEGLVELYPKRGALVLAVSIEEIRDVHAARELVECYAAEGAVRAGELLTPELRRWLAAMRAAAEAGDVATFAQADRAFHNTMVEAAGNRVVRRWYDQIRDRQLRMRTLLVPQARDRMATAIREHEAIVAAIEGGDVDTVRREVVAHLDTFMGMVLGQQR